MRQNSPLMAEISGSGKGWRHAAITSPWRIESSLTIVGALFRFLRFRGTLNLNAPTFQIHGRWESK
jgi:hypothetical protein